MPHLSQCSKCVCVHKNKFSRYNFGIFALQLAMKRNLLCEIMHLFMPKIPTYTYSCVCKAADNNNECKFYKRMLFVNEKCFYLITSFFKKKTS